MRSLLRFIILVITALFALGVIAATIATAFIISAVFNVPFFGVLCIFGIVYFLINLSTMSILKLMFEEKEEDGKGRI